MDSWTLPKALIVGNKSYRIRSDYRAVLDILIAMNDPEIFSPEMTDEEKQFEKIMTMLQILYIDFDSIPEKYYQEVLDKACEFIDCGIKDEGKQKPQLIDWNQDSPIIVPAINKIYGKDIRSLKYMHWWTFLGLYMEIGESTLSTVVSIRNKKNRGKKLDEWEMEFLKSNKNLVILNKKSPYTSEEKKALKKLFGIK